MDAFEGSLQVMDREAHWRLSHNVTQGQIGSFPCVWKRHGEQRDSPGKGREEERPSQGPQEGHLEEERLWTPA